MSRWNEAKVTDKRGGRQEVPSLIKLPLNIFTEILKIVSHCSLWWWLQIRLDLPTPTPVRIFCVLLVITTGSFEILLNMSVSQSCAILKSEKILAGHWTIKVGRQNGGLFHWPKCSCVSTKTKHWKLLLLPAICMRSLIIQWPARISHI